ncbi:PEP-utilizing enzyme [Octadecabacter sp. 1_MG-2023]|uniref:putative PEP-binding protein n=1 Tax=unclassified Octadecabacter TaxID=196158 RepID=UPI001C0801FB|nr:MULTISPECIES: putative PEP-binding protein [unclassified Octadecabacter]MBU2992790.1 pyruvate, phosphate dikinase [Octadecabacter sp. B2R22]MDO6733759.1 PEP-utilizing enzyme [Octadecabacter sp. 1_MG-2023]
MAADIHGGRAKCLQRLIRLDMPVPTTVAISFDAIRAIAAGQGADIKQILRHFEETPLLSVRPSSMDPDWGGPGAMLNIGLNDVKHAELCESLGEDVATRLYMRHIQSFAVEVARLDPEEFYLPDHPSHDALKAMLATYESEMDAEFPQDAGEQLSEVLRSMARAWEGTTARLLRQAKGAPADAGLGLVVQEMALALGAGVSGSGVVQFVDSTTGCKQVIGRFVPQAAPTASLRDSKNAEFLSRDKRGPSLEEQAPEAYQKLIEYGELVRTRLREEMEIKFVVRDGALSILDGIRLPRSSRAAVRIAVDLAESGVIAKEEAVMRVKPAALSELLHRQVDSSAKRDFLVRGIAASPGAASGRLVFSGSEAQASAARGEACVLVRRETTPEDIRGMHASAAVVTLRGGVTSHAAVIGRGIGLPCIVGAADLDVDERKRCIKVPDGRSFSAGDMVTVDGTTGQLLAGETAMLEAALDDGFQTLLSWADEVRDIGIRANADTPADAQTARNFAAEGIGLCRTEHMFFDGDRIDLMREMIFAETSEGRAAVLERLLPLQRSDFTELFRIMQGQPVCIRLFDPPLHEFLPAGKAGMRELAELLDVPLAQVTARVDDLSEYNPMLGMRGVRLGITVPEIYEMQARAIFEATVAINAEAEAVVPEIMIPLVSAMREVELVQSRVDSVAAAVHAETGVEFDYRLGVMVETPRAALRAADIAEHAAFLSFGTNDLTQMTYGLSRDDAGKFMSEYVNQHVYAEDPFHTLDLEGVGELLQLGAERGRQGRPDVTLSICGEHGGDTNAIAFCRAQKFDYVSCSPFRVPVARLSAAQLAIEDKKEPR